eukprot:10258312-Heterocapsa_arctica.AAC.1
MRLKIGFSSSDVVQNDWHSARNLMVIARMPEDRPKTGPLNTDLEAVCRASLWSEVRLVARPARSARRPAGGAPEFGGQAPAAS